MPGNGTGHATLAPDRTKAKRRPWLPIRWTVIVSLAVLAACNSGTPQQSGETVVEGTVHVCSSCHGLEGRSVSPTFPNLAGQQHDYLVAQLRAFRDQTRADPHAHTYMWGMAAELSDPTIDGLATYYAAQSPAPATPADSASIAAGTTIFANGIASRGVPACMTCHGAKAEGLSAFPRLAGQHPSYIEDQLVNFASQERANAIMHETSKDLTPAEMKQIAAYVGSL
jgi:cytochrome c553